MGPSAAWDKIPGLKPGVAVSSAHPAFGRLRQDGLEMRGQPGLSSEVKEERGREERKERQMSRDWWFKPIISAAQKAKAGRWQV